MEQPESFILTSYLPTWLIDSASIASIIGLAVSIFLFVEARKIRKSFIRKARIPEIFKDFDRTAKELYSHLKEYRTNNRQVHQEIQNAKALAETALEKMPNNHKDKIKRFIAFTTLKINTVLDEESSWQVYTELSGVVTYVRQLAKDSTWD